MYNRPQYEYKSLTPGYFRLIVLQPGEYNAPLVASILHAPLLTERPTPYYEALSYTWGMPEFHHFLKIPGEGSLVITPSLHAALTRLRYPDRSRTIWADAVCINQHDNTEKNHQVALMTQIYNRADKVLVHLGEKDEESDAAMQCIEDFERTVSDDDAYVVGKLLERPWFCRIWVVQEVARARVAVVICGEYCVAWDCFARWPFRAISRAATSMRQQSAIEQGTTNEIPSILNYGSGYTPSTGSDSLLQILHENRSARALNPLDKVFGILGLMADIKPYEQMIDYNETIPKVYAAVAWQILKDTKSLRLLSAAGLAEDPPHSHESRIIPSWVPDWSYPKPEALFGLGKTFVEPFNAGGRNCIVQKGSHGGRLRVEGVRIAEIAAVGQSDGLLRNRGHDPETIESWQDLNLTLEDPHKRSAGRGDLASYLKFLDSAIPGNPSPSDFLETISACPSSSVHPVDYPRSIKPMQLDRVSFSALEPNLQRRITRVTYNRRFFMASETTKVDEGHVFMGLGPATLEHGDIVVVLLGGPVPYVLRPSAARGGAYQLVGECYVHGIMNGEALHHVRGKVEAKGCMLPPTSVQRCSGLLEKFDLV